MKIAVAWIVVASAATSVQPVMHVTCQEGPYRIAPFHMTIDVDANTVDVLDNPSLSSDTLGPAKTTGATIEWTFMRGWAVFHRDTHVLEWDASDEYDYLDYIGQTPSDPRSTFAGASRCTVDG
jgi:hypothetical protein